jgi:hypothetical protein
MRFLLLLLHRNALRLSSSANSRLTNASVGRNSSKRKRNNIGRKRREPERNRRRRNG